MAWDLILDKKFNQNYQGHAEFCDWTFRVNLPDQAGASWTAQQSLNAHIEELQKQGAIILEYRLWEDKSPTWHTDYYVTVVSSASPLAWMAIILGVIVIIGLLVTYFAIRETGDKIEYIGEAAPITLPLLAIAGIGVVTIGLIWLVRREGPRERA